MRWRRNPLETVQAAVASCLTRWPDPSWSGSATPVAPRRMRVSATQELAGYSNNAVLALLVTAPNPSGLLGKQGLKDQPMPSADVLGCCVVPTCQGSWEFPRCAGIPDVVVHCG